jgi:hypothetical protein
LEKGVEQGKIAYKIAEKTKFKDRVKSESTRARIMLEKWFYKQLKEKVKRLKIAPEKLIYNAIPVMLKLNQ